MPCADMLIKAPSCDTLAIEFFSNPCATDSFMCPWISATNKRRMLMRELIETTERFVCLLWELIYGCRYRLIIIRF